MQTVLPREEEVEAIFPRFLLLRIPVKINGCFYDAMDDNHLLESDDQNIFQSTLLCLSKR